MAFYTDKQIEAWLETQTRDLPMPNGTTRPHTTFRLVWETVDSLVLTCGYSVVELTGYAIAETKLQNVTFEEAFDGVVAWLNHEHNKRWGIR